MRKAAWIALAVVLLGFGAYFGGNALASMSGGGDDAVGTPQGSETGSTADPNQPERVAEVKGVVLSVDGTSVAIERYVKDPAEELTEEQKAAKKAERAKLSQEERQALKATENAALETERVTVNVPVGTPIVQMVLVGDQAEAQLVALAAIRGGMEVTVWTDGGTDGASAEYVKIASAK